MQDQEQLVARKKRRATTRVQARAIVGVSLEVWNHFPVTWFHFVGMPCAEHQPEAVIFSGRDLRSDAFAQIWVFHTICSKDLDAHTKRK